MIDEILEALKEKWGYDNAELADIKIRLADYAVAAKHNQKIFDEAMDIVMDSMPQPTNIIYLEDYDWTGNDT